MRRLVLIVAFAFGVAVAANAAAQDPITSNPNVYHLVFENATVRVLHVTVPPGGKTVIHEHPDNAVVVLKAGKIKFTDEAGSRRRSR